MRAPGAEPGAGDGGASALQAAAAHAGIGQVPRQPAPASPGPVVKHIAELLWERTHAP
jgi:hypothetical protein